MLYPHASLVFLQWQALSSLEYIFKDHNYLFLLTVAPGLSLSCKPIMAIGSGISIDLWKDIASGMERDYGLVSMRCDELPSPVGTLVNGESSAIMYDHALP